MPFFSEYCVPVFACVLGLGYRVQALSSGFRVQGLGLGLGVGCRVEGVGWREEGSLYR